MFYFGLFLENVGIMFGHFLRMYGLYLAVFGECMVQVGSFLENVWFMSGRFLIYIVYVCPFHENVCLCRTEPFFENLWFVLQVLKNVEFMLGRFLRMYGLYIGPFFENV